MKVRHHDIGGLLAGEAEQILDPGALGDDLAAAGAPQKLGNAHPEHRVRVDDRNPGRGRHVLSPEP
jgi:hypothetical protein